MLIITCNHVYHVTNDIISILFIEVILHVLITAHNVSKQYYTLYWLTFSSILCSSTLASVYEQHKDVDGFIYMAYSGENSMG